MKVGGEVVWDNLGSYKGGLMTVWRVPDKVGEHSVPVGVKDATGYAIYGIMCLDERGVRCSVF
jgi:hypothetical protein